MIYTSYLGNLKNIPEDLKKVSIMRFTPIWSNDYIDKVDLTLAPTEKILNNFKEGNITEEEFSNIYYKHLSKIGFKTLKRRLNNTVLLCTCKIGRFCHRHVLAKYLKDNDVTVKELPAPKKDMVINVETVDVLSIKECKKNPDKIYVFGDNLIGKGKAGQAIIRDCPNTFGIPTKRYPSMKQGSFLKDSKEDKDIVFKKLYILRDLAFNGKTIVFPKSGLGMGLANMGLHCPFLHIKMYGFLQKYFLDFIKTNKDRPRIIIAGSRKIKDYEYIASILDEYLDGMYKPILLTGMATGPDRYGYRYAKRNKYDVEEYPADWNTHGKSAGYIRNAEMAKKATNLIAFWDGKSKGTKHMIDIAKKNKLKVKIIKYSTTSKKGK